MNNTNYFNLKKLNFSDDFFSSLLFRRDDMADDKWITVLEVEKQTSIPNATIRRYIRNHGHHLNIKKQGKSYLVASESTGVFKKIRDYYNEGKNTEQVEKALSQEGIPVTITVNDNDHAMNINIAEALLQLQKDVNEQKEINRSLLEQVKRQEESQLKRDQMLLKVIKEIQETKRLSAATQDTKKRENKDIDSAETEKKKGFFNRLFGK